MNFILKKINNILFYLCLYELYIVFIHNFFLVNYKLYIVIINYDINRTIYFDLSLLRSKNIFIVFCNLFITNLYI